MMYVCQDQGNHPCILDVEVLFDLSSLGGIYNREQCHWRSGVGSGPWEQLPIPIIAHHRQICSGLQVYDPPVSCPALWGLFLLIVCEYLHMLTVYRYWLWVVKLPRTHHSPPGTLLKIYQMENVIQMSAGVTARAVQWAINNQNKNRLFQCVISFTV